MQLRLNKFLAERLGVSRREADEWIAAGKVTVNGKPATLGMRVSDGTKADPSNQPKSAQTQPTNNRGQFDKPDEVCYNRKVVPWQANFTYLALNKPVGYVCSRKRQGEAETLYALLPPQYQKLKTVGRLDKNSSGLILLTDDGDFTFQMTHPRFHKIKIYEVELDRALAPLHQQMISDFGIEIGDGISRLGLTPLAQTNPASVDNHSNAENPSQTTQPPDRRHWRVEMSEGRNRQIRRTFAALGYTVTKLHRIQFGKYQLGNLKGGQFIEITKS